MMRYKEITTKASSLRHLTECKVRNRDLYMHKIYTMKMYSSTSNGWDSPM